MLVQLEREVDLGRSGRKRKDGPRYPSGGLVKDTGRAVDDKVRCGRQPHRRMLSEDLRLDTRAESPLGRMLLKGLLNRGGEAGKDEISDAARDRYEAGTMFAQIVGAYRQVIGTPRATAGGGRGHECAELCAAAHRVLSAAQRLEVHDGLFDVDTCPCLARKWRYDGAYEALDRAGRAALMAVNRAAVHGEAIDPTQLVNLVGGLDVLVRHFGLTPRRVPRHSRNAN